MKGKQKLEEKEKQIEVLLQSNESQRIGSMKPVMASTNLPVIF